MPPLLFRRFQSRLKRLRSSTRQSHHSGFTLIELLVVTVIGGLIVAGLTYIVVELMGSDQRESSRTETQREMQMSMDYINTELREATYIYPGSYLSTLGTYLPTSVTTNSTPVLAFWKQQPFPTVKDASGNTIYPGSVLSQCSGATPPAGVSCLSGHSYALVVYSLSTANSGRWQGKARITRYAMTQFDSAGQLNANYVDPNTNNNFATWPIDNKGTDLLGGKQLSGTAPVLVDFVSATAPTTVNCPPVYTVSPPKPTGGFYACISNQASNVNQDLIVYLQGDASGRPGISSNKTSINSFLPTLETRVLTRGVLSKMPPN